MVRISIMSWTCTEFDCVMSTVLANIQLCRIPVTMITFDFFVWPPGSRCSGFNSLLCLGIFLYCRIILRFGGTECLCVSVSFVRYISCVFFGLCWPQLRRGLPAIVILYVVLRNLSGPEITVSGIKREDKEEVKLSVHSSSAAHIVAWRICISVTLRIQQTQEFYCERVVL